MKRIFSYFKDFKLEAILAPVFKLLEALLELFIPLIVKVIIDQGIGENNTTLIIKMILLMILCGFVGLLFSITGQYFSAKTAVGISKNLRHDLFVQIEALSFTDIDSLGTSSIITRMTNDVNQLQNGINLTLRLFLRSPFVVFGAAIMATILSPNTSYIFWLVIPILSIVIFGIMLITMPKHKKVQENLDVVLDKTRESLTGVRVIRAFSMEDRTCVDYDESTKKLEKSQNRVGNISNLMNPLTYVIINLAIVILIYIGSFKVNEGIILQGTLIALYNYMSQILVELIKLANLIITMTKSVACGKRISLILSMNKDVVLTQEEKINKAYITFDNVSFTYKGAGASSLEDINLEINKGETIGIIGGTGSGKSTLIGLLSRFYDPTSGKIYLDGYNILNYTPEELKDIVSIVLQKAVLFKGTIRDNIRFGKSDATDEEINEALVLAMAKDVVDKKENGLDAIVEQNGKNFSGGQKQRLAIARTLVKKPPIIVFDDSSSALDYATDASLRKNIRNLSYKPTVFIVSQRTSSIQNADKIIVLDNGKLVGFDTHDNLLKNCVVYQEIYYSQFKKEGK